MSVQTSPRNGLSEETNTRPNGGTERSFAWDYVKTLRRLTFCGRSCRPTIARVCEAARRVSLKHCLEHTDFSFPILNDMAGNWFVMLFLSVRYNTSHFPGNAMLTERVSRRNAVRNAGMDRARQDVFLLLHWVHGHWNSRVPRINFAVRWMAPPFFFLGCWR